jgi:hypothetical protein
MNKNRKKIIYRDMTFTATGMASARGYGRYILSEYFNLLISCMLYAWNLSRIAEYTPSP